MMEMIDKFNFVKNIQKELKENIDIDYRNNFFNFFKAYEREKLKFYGVRSQDVKNTTKKYFNEIKELSKKEIFDICEDLLQLRNSEEKTIAFDFALRLKNKYEKSDFKIFENWIEKYVSNWGSCDDLCTHALGEFIYRFPEFLSQTRKWARSRNKWFRRASAVVLIFSLRRGKYLQEAFDRAKILLKDDEDLAQKGYGWMLKEASKTHQKEIFDFVMKNKKLMPRTALRYAIEKMPEKMKKEAMKK